MKKTLFISALAMSLFAFGCDDEADGNPDASRDGGDAGDARGDTSRDGADGGARDGVGLDGRGDVADMAEASRPMVDAVADMSGGGGTPDATMSSDAAFAVCRPTDMVGVSAADFCSYVMINCGFGSGPGKFRDTAACMLKYNGYTADQKACTAYHACVAGTNPQNAMLHCPHPVGVANNNPCLLPL